MREINKYYLNEIKKIPLLTRKEENEIAQKAFKGDKNAINLLVKSNLRFVITVASKFSSYMDMDDLINEGNMGLMYAATKFDPSNGAKFTTYAVWWIREYIQRAIRETSTGVRFPSGHYQDMKDSKWKFASLDKELKEGDEDSGTLASVIEDNVNPLPEDVYIESEFENHMNEMVENSLNEKQRTVIEMRYGLSGNEPKSLSKIGEELGYTKEGIRNIEIKSLRILRNRCIQNKDVFDEIYAA